MSEGIQYRKVEPRDLSELKRLHEIFFPVKYTDAFYDDAVQGIGINGKPLYVVVVEAVQPSVQAIDNNKPAGLIQQESCMIGFVLAQLMDVQEIDDDLFGYIFSESPNQICYILTIGVEEGYRRHGVGRTLLRMVHEYSINSKSCGAVSLSNVYNGVFTTNEYVCTCIGISACY